MEPSIGISYARSIGKSYAGNPQSTRVAKFHDTGFWDRLVEALNDAGVRENYQTAVANMIGIKQPSVHEWQEGESMPSMANVVKLAIELNADVQYLYTGKRSKYHVPHSDHVALDLWELWPRLSESTKGRLLGIAQESQRQLPGAQPAADADELHRSSG